MKRKLFLFIILFSFFITTGAQKTEEPANLLTDWEISRAFPAARLDISKANYPRFNVIFLAGWQTVAPDASGRVDISKYHKKRMQEPRFVLARTMIRSDKSQAIKLSFAANDETCIFLNKKKIFYEPSAAGLNKTVDVTLKKGLNEIFLVTKEGAGGWGFTFRADRALDRPIKQHNRLQKAWETPPVFLTPESVLYNPKQDILYVTNFDNKFKRSAAKPGEFTGYISKVKLNGEIENRKWVTQLHAPCGMCIYQDKLYIVERRSLAEIDIESGKILKRYPVPGTDFPNDAAVDSAGNIYITDTSPSSHPDSRIYRFKDGKIELWLDSPEIIQANALFLHKNNLLVGNSGDGCLKSVNLADKKIDIITCLGGIILDGIRVDHQGNFLVSHWAGQTYMVSPSGDVVEILNTLPLKLNTADFEYIKEKKLLIIPTFLGNKVAAYRLVE